MFSSELACCRLCPRRCGADRASGRIGYCRAGDRVRIYTFGAHFGEEPPISGTAGSGTIFFSCCTLRCIYCQNFRWSQNGEGIDYDLPGLCRILSSLHEQGCHNWNLVSPTPWLPFIVEAVSLLEQRGVSLPVVYNTSGFESVDTLRKLDGFADIYLADLRYSCDEIAASASEASGYVCVARDALAEMWRQTGPLRLDGQGRAVFGTICRLLVLPGNACQAVDNIRWLKRNIGTEIPISIMSQYLPAAKAVGHGDWGRQITGEEYELVCDEAEHLGFRNGWIQDYSSHTIEELVGFNMKPGADDRMAAAQKGMA